jgi:uncharacterized protein (TIGR04551 family)
VGVTTGEQPPRSGINAFMDSISVKKAWAEVLTPIGLLYCGRMPNEWGLGLLANPGTCLDCDYDDSVDRIGFTLPLLSHYWAFAFDINANGQTSGRSYDHDGQPFDIDDADDVYTASFAFFKKYTMETLERKVSVGKYVPNYGFYFTYRRQAYDLPAYYLAGLAGQDGNYDEGDFVARKLNAFAFDVWFRLNGPWLRVELEAAFLYGKVGDSSMNAGIQGPAMSSKQFGFVLQSEFKPWPYPVTAMLEIGFASGDSAPGFGVKWPQSQLQSRPGDLDGPQFVLPNDLEVDNFKFHRNYHVDQILWRHLIGTVTDAIYVKVRGKYYPWPSLLLRLDVIYSRAHKPSSTPSGNANLGVELDLNVTYFSKVGFQARLDYAVLFPLSGLDNPTLGLSASPAHMLRGMLAYVF